MAAPHTPPTQWPMLLKNPLHLQRHIHCPSATGMSPTGLHLSHGSIALSHLSHCCEAAPAGETMRCRKTEPSTFLGIPLLFSDKSNQQLDSIWKEMRNGYSLGQRKHDQRKNNSHHHRKGWENFFGRHQCRRTCQMVGVVPPGSQNLLNFCTSSQTWERRRSQQAIT